MKRILSLIVLVIIVKTADAQISNVSSGIDSRPLRVGSVDKVEGSPYLESANWYAGEIIDITGKKHVRNVRYNAFHDRVEYFEDGQPFYFDNDLVKSFSFSVIDNFGQETRYEFANRLGEIPGFNPNQFYRVLYNGDDLKIVEHVKAVKITVTPNAYGEDPYEKYVFDNVTYIINKGELSKFKVSKRSFKKEFPSLKNKLTGYFKENNIVVLSDSDCRNLGEFIEENL